MKEAGTLNWITPNTGGNNSSGFAGLPGGFRESNGAFFSVAYYGSWWSATVSDNTTNAWYRYLSNNSGGLSRFNGGKKKGFSVRCLRD
jgi:uncharacterized protein (TIGR02145 family)